MSDDFIRSAREIYIAANAGTLRWMLARPALHGVYLNTKVNSITLGEYGDADGFRGPAYTYGWIQGRGLEALVRHAEFFAAHDPVLAADLDARGRALYAALAELQQRDGHAYFCYDAGMQPVRFVDGRAVPQMRADVFTYSDAFVAKGLVAGAARYAPQDIERRLADLDKVVAAIEAQHFQMNEAVPLSAEAAQTQPPDFGPRMILLGAAELLAGLGRTDHLGFTQRFIGHILSHHLDLHSGLLANVPGEDACNVGHAIEFAGFAMAWLGADAPPELAATLETILVASFDRGFIGPGVALSVSIGSGSVLNPLCPWWSLPETIRTAALCHAYSHSDATLRIWRQAHDAFFGTYWRGQPAIAYQTMGKDGPVDFVPATPDLDPGYHTGLSLLGAIEAFEA